MELRSSRLVLGSSAGVELPPRGVPTGCALQHAPGPVTYVLTASYQLGLPAGTWKKKNGPRHEPGAALSGQ